jgi:hypothetical protein
MTAAQMQAQIASLQKQLADEKTKNKRTAPGITIKQGNKGNVCVYGLGRFPVTLYAEQWQRLLGKKDDILGFIDTNREKLTFKNATA